MSRLLSATPTAPLDAPTLLVLRVFGHDAQVERLFDQIIERWRLSGNTVLIADADIASAAANRFVWLSAERMDSATAERVLSALFD